MQLASPYAYAASDWYPRYGGPPTDFSADASNAGVQPSPDSEAWTNLLNVNDMTFPLVPNTNGIFSHNFNILPQNGYQVIDDVPLDDLELSLSDPLGTNLSINAEEAFPSQSRNCCSTFTAAWRDDDASTLALPRWLSLIYGLVPDEAPAFETDQPFWNSALTLQLASYPGVQAVGNYTIDVTATSADEVPTTTTKSFTLRVGAQQHCSCLSRTESNLEPCLALGLIQALLELSLSVSDPCANNFLFDMPSMYVLAHALSMPLILH